MFYALTVIQFAFVFSSLVISPFVILGSKKAYKFFGVLFFELILAQLFMHEPGLDVSPYAFSHGHITSIKMLGFTLSSLTSIAIDWFVVCYLLLRKVKISRREVALFTCALIPNLIAYAKNFSFSTELADFIKILSPLLIYIFIKKVLQPSNVAWFSKLLTAIDILLIGQVFVCRIIYGAFSAHNYYYEISQETFGYYCHPHAFNGLLAFMVIWNVYKVNKKEHVGFNVVLASISVVLMWFSGVRTYILSLGVGLAYIGFTALNRSSMKNIRKLVYASLGACTLFGPYLIASFGSIRVYTDFSSGRIARWIFDLSYMFQTSPSIILTGGGMRFIEKINKTFVGYEINSLNLLVDNFANYGLIGLCLMIFAYFTIFKDSYVKNAKAFQVGILLTFMVASCISSVAIYMSIMTVMVFILCIIKAENNCIVYFEENKRKLL